LKIRQPKAVIKYKCQCQNYLATDGQSVIQSVRLGLEALCDSWPFGCSQVSCGFVCHGV